MGETKRDPAQYAAAVARAALASFDNEITALNIQGTRKFDSGCIRLLPQICESLRDEDIWHAIRGIFAQLSGETNLYFCDPPNTVDQWHVTRYRNFVLTFCNTPNPRDLRPDEVTITCWYHRA